LENVALPLAYKGMTPVRRWQRASDMLERVSLRDREYFLPRHLSSGLDSFDSKVVMELFADIHRQGNTILLVTHNPELTRYASRVIYMSDGMIVGDEKTAIGSLAKGARRIYFSRYRRTVEDVAAGVSALMHDVPGKEVAEKAKSRKPTKHRKARRKVKRKAAAR
jgi:putative ABC transport system ATP-binding protein